MSPLARLFRAPEQGLELPEDPYTELERDMVERLKLKIAEIHELAAQKNGRLEERFQEEPDLDLRVLALTEVRAYTRIQIPNF